MTCAPSCVSQRMGHARRIAVDLARVEAQHDPACGKRAATVFREQGALADASRAVHEEHSRCTVRVVSKRLFERCDFGGATDKGASPRRVQPGTQTGDM